jgi:RNA polymerase sigma factor (sigma-70 family)
VARLTVSCSLGLLDAMTTPPGDFSNWYEVAYPRVAAALLAVAGDTARAKEATDEAFARAWQHWGRVGMMDSPTGWAVVVGRNFLLRRVRQSATERSNATLAEDSVVESAPPWDVELVEAIARLPRRQRLAIALRYAADLSVRDTAKAMGVSEGTITATLHAAKANLAKALSGTELATEMHK